MNIGILYDYVFNPSENIIYYIGKTNKEIIDNQYFYLFPD
jgi:hypothetical protein